jgi:integrase
VHCWLICTGKLGLKSPPPHHSVNLPPSLPALGDIVSYGLWMRRQGYRETTIHFSVKSLIWVAKRTQLLEPEAVKAYLASAKTSESRKRKLVEDLARFYRYKGIPFDRPRYKKTEKIPFIPLESEVGQLVSGMTKKGSAFLQLLRETGMRCGEAWSLEWKDIDFEKGVVNIFPEKNSYARQLKISSRLVAMLNCLSKEYGMVFRNPEVNPIDSIEHFRRNFIKRRKRLAQNLQNQRINAITFHSLRHFKATMEYRRTKDILFVQKILGHKSIVNTMRYTHLVNFEGDEYVCKVVRTVEEAKNLVENGFDYVTDVDNMKLFRKRK